LTKAVAGVHFQSVLGVHVVVMNTEILKLLGVDLCAPDVVVMNTENLKLLGVDLCRPDLLTAVLEAVGIDFSLPTLILSEVVLTYLPPARYRCVLIIILFSLWCTKHTHTHSRLTALCLGLPG